MIPTETPRKPNYQTFFETIAAPVLYEKESPYKLMTRKLNDIDIDYFQGVIAMGQTLNNELSLDIKHRILSDFVKYGEDLIAIQSDPIEKKIITGISRIVNDYSSRDEAISDLTEALKKTERFIREQLCFVPIPMYDNAELRELYNAAKRITLLERVTGSNDKDVIKYYHALIEHTVWACRMLMRRRIGLYMTNIVTILSLKFKIKF